MDWSRSGWWRWVVLALVVFNGGCHDRRDSSDDGGTDAGIDAGPSLSGVWKPVQPTLPQRVATELGSLILTASADGSTAFLLRDQHVFQRRDGETSWVELAPLPFNYFEKAIVPSSDGRTLYVSNGGGVLVYDAASATWTQTAGGRFCLQVVASTVDPLRAWTISRGAGPGITSDSLLVTTDGGKTWNSVFEGAPGIRFVTFAVAPNAPDTIYVSWASDSANGLLVSKDGGLHFAEVGSDLHQDQIVALAVSPRDARVVLAIGASAHLSRDEGESWRMLENFPRLSGSNATLLPEQPPCFDPATPGTIYAKGLSTLVSRDDGATWTSLDGSRASSLGLGIPQRVGASLLFIARHPAVVYRTIDFTTVKEFSAGLPTIAQSPTGVAVTHTDAGPILLLSADFLYRLRPDAADFELVRLPGDPGYGSPVVSMVADTGQPGLVFVVTKDGKLFSTQDATETWTRLSATPEPMWWVAARGSSVLVGSEDGGTWWSGDQGTSFTALVRPLDGAFFSPANPMLVFGTASTPTNVLVSVSTNGGKDWSEGKSLPVSPKPKNAVMIAPDASDASVALARWLGTDQTFIAHSSLPLRSESFLVSRDRGQTWSPLLENNECYYGIPPCPVVKIVSPLLVARGGPDPAYFSTAWETANLVVSHDTGASWTDLSDGLGQVTGLAFDEPSGTSYAITQSGVFIFTALP